MILSVMLLSRVKGEELSFVTLARHLTGFGMLASFKN